MLETWGASETVFAFKHHTGTRLLMNSKHIKGKVEFKCPAQITTWLKNCLEVMPVEKIKRTALKEKQLIWNGSHTQSHYVLVSLIMILPASDPSL